MRAATKRHRGLEVGMQNSGLGVALALKYFSAAALPSAIFSIRHNQSGALTVAYWSWRSELSQDMSKSPPNA